MNAAKCLWMKAVMNAVDLKSHYENYESLWRFLMQKQHLRNYDN